MKKRELRDDIFSSYILSDFMDGLFYSVIFSIREFLKIDRIVYRVQEDSCCRHCLHFCSFAYVFAYRRRKHVRCELRPGS